MSVGTEVLAVAKNEAKKRARGYQTADVSTSRSLTLKPNTLTTLQEVACFCRHPLPVVSLEPAEALIIPQLLQGRQIDALPAHFRCFSRDR